MNFRLFFLLIALVVSANTIVFAQMNVPMFQWSNHIEGIYSLGYNQSIDLDEWGNAYWACDFNNSVLVNHSAGSDSLTAAGTTFSFVLQKIAPGGSANWMHVFDQSQSEAVTVGLDGGPIMGSRHGNIDFDPSSGVQMSSHPHAIFKLDSAGSLDWVHEIGQSVVNVYDIATSANGGVVATGRYMMSIDFDPLGGSTPINSAGDRDAYVIKLDTNGSFQWGVTIGGTGEETGHSIALDFSGNIYSTGFFNDTVDFDPSLGVASMVSSGQEDIYIQKLDPAGGLVWVKTIGGLNTDKGRSIATDENANVYVFGEFSGMVDFDPSPVVNNLASVNGNRFILKLDSNGNFLWVKQLKGNHWEMEYDNQGGLYTCGSFSDTLDFDPSPNVFNMVPTSPSLFVLHLDTNGNFAWVRSTSGAPSSFVTPLDIAANEFQDVAIAGRFWDTVDFDPSTDTNFLTPISGEDPFAMKLSQCVQTTGVDVVNTCDSLLWIDGNVYYASDTTASFVLVGGNVNGCDSLVHLDLTINYSTHDYDTVTACNSYEWIDGNTYTQSAILTFVNSSSAANGCDYIFHLNLTIHPSSASTDHVVACDSYTWIDGVTYTSSNSTATYITPNAVGCDSVITLDLTLNEVSNLSVLVQGDTLMSNNPNASYQWLNCDSNYSPLLGDTFSMFTPAQSGSYAVALNENGCVDTSSCVPVVIVGYSEQVRSFMLSVYPNPAQGFVNIMFEQALDHVELTLTDNTGRIIKKETYDSYQSGKFMLPDEAGVYFIGVKTPLLSKVFSLVKN